MTSPHSSPPTAASSPGSPVVVRNRFTGEWTGGFRIEEVRDAAETAYRLRRLSDDVVLPATFAAEDVRPV